jgi:hypothetical protein
MTFSIPNRKFRQANKIEKGIKIFFCSFISFFQNLLLVKEANVPHAYGGIEYLGFEKLTFVPIQVHYCFSILFLKKDNDI